MRPAPIALSLLLAASLISGPAAQGLPRLVETLVLANYAGDWFTLPTAINNAGAIAGWAIGPDDQSVAFVRTPRGQYRRIADRAMPTDMSTRGEIVGTLFPCDGETCWLEGFSWTGERGLRNLGSFIPWAVNDRGDMAGRCESSNQACVRRDGVVSVVGARGSVALGINAPGDVVGSHPLNRAFRLTRQGRFQDIGLGFAEAINDSGVIAGHRWIELSGRGERGVVTAWMKSGPRSPAPEASLGVAINNRGWIISNAFDENEESYSFVWDPASNRRVLLESATGGRVSLRDINDRGDVVGLAGGSAVLWRVRRKDLRTSP